MTLIDANILLYAYNESSQPHLRARQWLETVMSAPEPVGLAWITIMAFLRITTNPRAFDRPLSPAEATSAVSDWLSQPNVAIFNPGERHWDILRRLITQGQTRGPLLMDAHLAALAIEHGLVLCTTDRDFARFPALRFRNPLDFDT